MSNWNITNDPGRWLGGALIASLALNLFLGGFIAARTFSGPSLPNTEPVQIDFRTLPQGLPIEIREDIEGRVKLRRREIQRAYRNLQDAREQLGELLTQDHVNPEQLDAAFSRLRSLQVEIQSPLHAALADTLELLDPEERRQLIVVEGLNADRELWFPRRVDGRRWQFRRKDGRSNFEFRRDEDENGNEGREDR